MAEREEATATTIDVECKAAAAAATQARCFVLAPLYPGALLRVQCTQQSSAKSA